MDDKVMEKYQIISPATFTAGPRDPFGNLGPLEQAVASTPLLSHEGSGEYIDVLRAIRSFDLCMACSTH
jgi:Ni,Fe-hydrogenase I large subunit